MKSIPIDDVEDADNDRTFYVHSQTNSKHMHYVDVEAYICDCDSSPLVSYCKYLAMVQFHFYEELDIQPMDSLLTQAANTSTTAFSILEATTAENTVPNPDRTILAAIPEKLQ